MREGGHFALQKRPHNLVAPNAVAHIATSQKGLACTPRDPKCGRFFFVFLDFGQISPPAIFGQPWPATGGEGGRGGGGGGVQPAQPRLAAARNTPVDGDEHQVAHRQIDGQLSELAGHANLSVIAMNAALLPPQPLSQPSAFLEKENAKSDNFKAASSREISKGPFHGVSADHLFL